MSSRRVNSESLSWLVAKPGLGSISVPHQVLPNRIILLLIKRLPWSGCFVGGGVTGPADMGIPLSRAPRMAVWPRKHPLSLVWVWAVANRETGAVRKCPTLISRSRSGCSGQ